MNLEHQNQYLIKPDGNGGRADTKLAVEFSEEEITEFVADGYVIVNQDDFNKLIGNAGKEYLIASDGIVYQKPDPTEEELLALAKPAKITEFKANRDTEEVEPIEYNGSLFDYDDKARDRINAAIIALDTQGEGASISWTTADNQEVIVTAADLRAVIAAVAVRSNVLHVKYRQLKEQIETATTMDELDAIVW